MKGHIARRYGDLAQDLWSGSSRSLAPLKLRVSISLGKNSYITTVFTRVSCALFFPEIDLQIYDVYYTRIPLFGQDDAYYTRIPLFG